MKRIRVPEGMLKAAEKESKMIRRIICFLVIAGVCGCGPFPNSHHGKWHVWYVQKGVLDEHYEHLGQWDCGDVDGLRRIDSTSDQTFWAAYVSPIGGAHGEMKYLGYFSTREQAERAVETSIECRD